MAPLRDAAMTSKAWPFEEARRVLKRYEKKAPEKGYVLFETGYGPSGLPHIGTFGEVGRTTMVPLKGQRRGCCRKFVMSLTSTVCMPPRSNAGRVRVT